MNGSETVETVVWWRKEEKMKPSLRVVIGLGIMVAGPFVYAEGPIEGFVKDTMGKPLNGVLAGIFRRNPEK